MSSAGAGAGAGGAGQQKQKRNDLDSDYRDVVIAELLRGSSAGKLQKGDIQRVAVKFDSNRWTIARLRGLFFSSPVYDTDMNVRLLLSLPTAVPREKRGKIIKLTRLTMLFARAETRGCYPGIPWAYAGDAYFRPLFMI